MTVIAKTMYVAECDYPGCNIQSSDFDHGNNTVYDTAVNLAEQFTRRFEGSLSDDWGWIAVGDKHYCGDHTTWDDDTDERVPMSAERPSGSEA